MDLYGGRNMDFGDIKGMDFNSGKGIVLDDSKGGISVFLCIVLAAVIFFSGAMVDIARIAAAQRRVQQSANSAARSVMAGYDVMLMGDYGIFGLNRNAAGEKNTEGDINGIYNRYLAENLISGSGFSLVKYSISDKGTGVDLFGSLIDDDIMEKQIKEYMKYRTPVNAVLKISHLFGESGLASKLDSNLAEKQARACRNETCKSAKEADADACDDADTNVDSDVDADPVNSGQYPVDSNNSAGNLKNLANKISADLSRLARKIDDSWLITGNAGKSSMQESDTWEEAMAGAGSARDKPADNIWEAAEAVARDGGMSPDVAENHDDGILSFAGRLFDTVRDTASHGLDRYYTVDYINDRFTCLTSQTDRSHFFSKGEVEYILCGDSSQLKCVESVMAEIGFMRFCIDTVDYFAASADPHPVFRLTYAVIKGLIRSCYDCCELYNGKNIALCPSLEGKQAFKLDYRDHLSLLLLLQPHGIQLQRIRQLMQVNIMQSEPYFRIERCDAIVGCRADVRMNLWFLGLFRPDLLGIPGFDGNGYRIRKEVYIGY